MRRVVLVTSVAGVLAALALSVQVHGQQPPPDPRVAAYDKGSAKIDVSKYPPDMRDRYKLFTAKCGLCHTLARPINSDKVLEDEVDRDVKRMITLSGTFISGNDGQAIVEFLVYDAKTRKKALYDQRVAGGG